MNVLIMCESSGALRDRFFDAGHNVYSVDLLPGEGVAVHRHIVNYGENVLSGHAFELPNGKRVWPNYWDLMIAHPPCTYLASSGLHWNKRRPERAAQTEQALRFVHFLMGQPIERIAIENPIGCISSRIRKPDQIVQPWYYGDDASKSTCWWLKNLPLLQDTNRLPGDRSTRRANQTPSGQNKLGPSADRWKLRSATYPGMADAIVDQWGAVIS